MSSSIPPYFDMTPPPPNAASESINAAIQMSHHPEIDVPGFMDLGDRPPSTMDCVAKGVQDSAEMIFRCRIL